MEALVVVFCTFLSVSVLQFSDAITCSEIAQCEYDSHVYTNAHIKNDVTTQCSLLDKSVDCMEAAIDDCVKNSYFPEKKLHELNQALDMHKQQVMAHCSNSDQASLPLNDSLRSSLKVYRSVNNSKSPMCTDIMTCMFDMRHFRKALKENRLTEACSLINPTVKCFRLAIKDCKENRFIDNEDIINATRSLTDAEKLLENYCGYTRENENIKDTSKLETSENKQTEVDEVDSKTETKTQEHSHESKAKENTATGYETWNDGQQNSKGDSQHGRQVEAKNSRQNDGYNNARKPTISGIFTFLIFLNIGIFYFVSCNKL